MINTVGMHPGASAPNTTPGASAPNQNNGASAPNQQNQNNDTEYADAPGCIPTGIPTDSQMCVHKYPQRRNIRAEFHNYSGGDYFVTICTRNKEHYFGKITNGEMHFSIIGEFANQALENLNTHYYSYVEVPMFVVMPNHVHAVITIRERADAPGCIPTIRTALGVVVGGYKQAVTRFARRNNIEFGWQSRYYDHIIRGTHDGNMISEYIANNVARWADDCFGM